VSLLSRYLARQNLFLMFVILLICTSLFLLIDMFERLDTFLERGVNIRIVLLYYSMKIPMIVSMLLPAIFMIAMVVQMNMLERSRELIALTAGGVSPAVLVLFVILYGFVWSVAQFVFAQGLGVQGERASIHIWREEVRGKIQEEAKLSGLWFTERNHIVHIGICWPLQDKGEDLQVYRLDEAGVSINEIIRAKKFTVGTQGWTLEEGKIITPAMYTAIPFDRMDLSIRQDLRSFHTVSPDIRPKHLSLRELSDAISRLEHAGSNVESLRSAWHEKLAYACSIVVMSMLALLISRLTSNIYKAIVISMLILFFFHGINTACVSMGEKGILKPFIGAWLANLFFFCMGSLCLAWPSMRSRLQKILPADTT
jgi:lipopolysaccharide export system permease protein